METVIGAAAKAAGMDAPAPADNAPTPETTPPTPPKINAGAGEGLPELDRPTWLPEKFQKPEDLAKSYTELERKLGTASAIPKEDAKPEEWAAFWNKAGRPESPDKYELKTPSESDGWDKNMETLARQRLHGAGLTQRQMQATIDLYLDVVGQQAESVSKGAKETISELKTEWGGAFDDNMNLMATALRQLGGDDAVRLFTHTPLGNNSTMIRLLSRVGRALGESGFVDGQAASKSQDSLQSEINDLMASKAYGDRRDPTHADTVAKVQRLFEAMYPAQA